MRKRLLLLFPLAATLVAQTGLDGSWLGTLAAGAVNLRLVLKVTKAADGSLARGRHPPMEARFGRG